MSASKFHLISEEHAPQWRTGLNTMPQRWAAVLANSISDILHDTTFLVGPDKQKISCHRLVLAVASPVFQVMFSEAFKPKGKVATIDVPDLDFIGFQNILKYAYTGTIDVQMKDALPTMYAANKYDIPEVVQHCSDLLRENLSVENAITVYQSAEILQEIQLMDAAHDCIVKNFQEIVTTKDFMECTRNNLCEFLKGDGMQIKSEVDLFLSIIRWGKHQCSKMGKKSTKQNLIDALGDIVKHIRFATMTPKEFATSVEPTGILSDKDCYIIFKYFSLPETDRHSVRMPYNTASRINSMTVNFWNMDKSLLSCNGRRFDSYSQNYMNHQQTYYTNYGYHGITGHRGNVRSQSFKITSTKGPDFVYLKAVSLIGPPQTFNDIDVEVTVSPSPQTSRPTRSKLSGVKRQKPLTDANRTSSFKAKAVTPWEMYDIAFEEPVEISANGVHTLSVTYIQGQPVDMSQYPLPSQNASNNIGTSGSSTPLTIVHASGHLIVAALKVLS